MSLQKISMVNIIVAIDSRGAIGNGGDMVYHISEDLRRFRELTTGNTVVMGRKTFESLPKGALPNRRNIVVSRNPEFEAPGAELAPSLEEALELAAEGPGETFIIGGAQIYAAALPLADRLYLTMIEATAPEADTHFPSIDPSEWRMTELSELMHSAKGAIPFHYATFERAL